MTESPGFPAWQAWHIQYGSGAARHPLLNLVGDETRTPWFWIDLHALAPVMEIGFPATNSRGRRAPWLESALRSGLAVAAREQPTPAVCNAALFPHRRRPTVWTGLLAATSARALSVLGAQGSADAHEQTSDHVIVGEVTALYDSLVPDGDRPATASWHLAWLEATVGNSSPSPARSCSSYMPQRSSPPAVPHSLVASLCRWSAETAHLIGTTADELWTPVVARLCHIQAVRLGGAEAGRRAETAALRAITGR